MAGTNIDKNQNHEEKRSYRKAKRRRIDEIAPDAEVTAEQRDMKKVYDTRRLLSGRRAF